MAGNKNQQMKYSLALFLVALLFACKADKHLHKDEPLTANKIVDSTIAVSGGKVFGHAIVQFYFRGVKYKAIRNNGRFELSRVQKQNNDSVLDIIDNDGFKRIVNTINEEVSDSMAVRYAASVNSVHYFSVLPYGLNDTAVNKKLLGEEHIKNNTYYKIEVTFDEIGGGEDYEDVFIYWIAKENFKTEYLAYSFNEIDGKGMRFREAYNERYQNGLRFVDYNNFKAENDTTRLEDLGKAFEANTLQLVSKIELEDISVELINH